MTYKQVIIVRADLKMPKGKVAAQVAHAAVEATLRSDKKDVRTWRDEGMKKIVVKTSDRAELFSYKRKAEKAGLVTAVITDAGKTFFKRSTVTCMGIGPAPEEKIDNICADLKML